jgi:potassium-transporting ATPase ATP-binding subunit
MMRADNRLFTPEMIGPALRDAVRKLHPRDQARNPVLFTVWCSAAVITVLIALVPFGIEDASLPFMVAIAVLLWLTLLFANVAEALAEGRGRAQAASLRQLQAETLARVLPNPADRLTVEARPATALRRGDCIVVTAGEVIPADGEIIEGTATVDESAITGESAPVVREAGGDRSAVTAGTTLLSDTLVIRVTADPGGSFLDRMIALIESASRQKTPNEIALDILLGGLTVVFLVVVVTLHPFAAFAAGGTGGVSITLLAALLVCLIPTTIGGLLSAIGIAGMDRMLRANVVAKSGRAIEAAGDVDVLLLDKTGTITYGNRQATAFLPAPSCGEATLAAAAALASVGDDTPEGRSIVRLAVERGSREPTEDGTVIPFTATTRMSGRDIGERIVRKGAVDAVERHVRGLGGTVPAAVASAASEVAAKGATPLLVADGATVLGVVALADVVKPAIKARFGELRRMGIRTVMVTGDNPLTAAAIAAEAGVDDFLAEATPEAKLELLRREQTAGRLVAMTGDGTNDAPALAQADVALAMQAGTQAAREAANLVDLDSDPTKLIEVVGVGKQMLMTRGALTTFSLANDVAKYFAILPAAFVGTYPELAALDVMQLGSPTSAILSAVIFNAVIILALVPLALRGVPYRAESAADALRRNLVRYGLGGLVAPFIGIKLIDLVLAMVGIP